MRRTAALIVGGGPAGAAAAIGLARGGAKPLLIERTPGPHDVVCGGFLGWDALAALDKLGLDANALGARPIHRLRLIAGKRSAEAPLPYPAAGLSRRTLDSALLERAATEGAAIERGVAAREAEGTAIRTADGARIDFEALFLATGKYELRGLARQACSAGSVGARVALAASPALTRALDGIIELHLFEQGYAGLLLQEDGSANLCLSVGPRRLGLAGGKPEALIAAVASEAPLLAERFGSANTSGPWSAVAQVPYGWRTRASRPGLFRVGDQAAVIASLAGDGIAIALASGTAAAAQYLRGGPDGAMRYQRLFGARARRPLLVAELLRSLGERPALAEPLVGLFARLPAAPKLLARLTRIGG